MHIAPYGRPLQHIPMHNRREARLLAEPTIVRIVHTLELRIATLAGDDSPDLAGTAMKLLFYADDLVLMSKSLWGLQKQLDELSAFCKEQDLTVNVKKTKVVIFGSRVNSSPLHYDGSHVEKVASFRYLRIELHRSGSLKTAVEHLAVAGQRAVFTLR